MFAMVYLILIEIKFEKKHPHYIFKAPVFMIGMSDWHFVVSDFGNLSVRTA